MNHSAIYEDFLSHCPAASLPYAWSRFGGSGDFRQLPVYDDTLLEALHESYPKRHLVLSGLLAANRRRIEINPLLAGRPNAFLPLRPSAEAAPFDLLTDGGTIRQALPLYAAAGDYRVRQAIQETGYLFAACSHMDLQAMMAVGMPVVPAAGLERFSPDSMESFRKTFGYSEPVPEVVPHHLVLVNFELHHAARVCPPVMERIVINLTRNRRCLGLPLHHILLWRPSHAEIRDIISCLRLGTKQDLIAALCSSIAHSAKPLVPESEASDPLKDLVRLERRLHSALMDPTMSSSQRTKLLRKHRRAVEEVLAQPLVERAQETTDPGERARLTVAAQLLTTLRPAAAYHAALVESQLREHGLRLNQSVLDLHRFTKTYDSLLKLLKEEE